MAALTLTFDDGTRLTIDGPSVTLARAGAEPIAHAFANVDVAAVVFEANATALEARQPHAAHVACDPALPGVLADLGYDDDRTFVRIVEGALVAAHVYDGDPVGYWDGLRPQVLAAPPFGAFVPDDAPHEVLGLHALRRLLAHPAFPACPRFGIEAWGRYIDPLLDRLEASGRASVLTHLFLFDPWSTEERRPTARVRPLGEELPALRMLSMPLWSWPLWSDAPFANVERLALGGGTPLQGYADAFPVVPPLFDVLDDVVRKAPALRHLAFRTRAWTAADLARLAAHPVLAQLTTLELFNVHHALDHEALLAARPHLAHLGQLVIGRHLVPAETLARYADWPAVTLASFDRRELVEYDRRWGET